MTRRPPRAVLFDLDGTLVDSSEAHVAIWSQVFRDAGHPVDDSAVRGQIGKGGDLLVPTLLPDLHKEEGERLTAAHGALFKRDRLAGIRPFPGATALIERVCAGGVTVVLASSASADELDHYRTLLGIDDLVEATTTADDVATSKPAADIFATALGKAGVAADDAIVVGDTPYDIDAARKAGIATVAVRSGGFSDDALAGAAAIYDDVAALLAGFDTSPLAR